MSQRGAGGMLDVLRMNLLQIPAKHTQSLAELRDKATPNEIPHWLLLVAIREDGNVKDVLVLLGVMSNFWNLNLSLNLVTIRSLARELQLKLDIEDGNDLALPLAHIHIALHTRDLVDLDRDAI